MSATHRRPFSAPEIAFLTGVPLLWGILLLFHPTGDDYYTVVKDQVSTWQTVHLGTMVFIPLMAGVMFLLLRGVEGIAATVSRVALGFFAVFYLAWEVWWASAPDSSWTTSTGSRRLSAKRE